MSAVSEHQLEAQERETTKVYDVTVFELVAVTKRIVADSPELAVKDVLEFGQGIEVSRESMGEASNHSEPIDSMAVPLIASRLQAIDIKVEDDLLVAGLKDVDISESQSMLEDHELNQSFLVAMDRD